MDNDYKPTTHGRALMAKCMALEQPLQLTRVLVGSGMVPEAVNLADVHELYEPVTEGEIGARSHENDRLYLTIEYANNLHPEQKTFFLSEFIVYAADPETDEETDLLYATLGDYRQPVPAYHSELPPSVFSFPLVMVLSDEVEVSITSSPGLVTHDDLQRLVNEGVIGISRTDITIPTNGWNAAEDSGVSGQFGLSVDIEIKNITERMTPMLTIYPEYLPTAFACGIAQTVRTIDGALRVYAQKIPDKAIVASLSLIGGSGYIGTIDSGSAYELPAASQAKLGGVKVGSGLNVSTDGTLSVDPVKTVTSDDLVNEEDLREELTEMLKA